MDLVENPPGDNGPTEKAGPEWARRLLHLDVAKRLKIGAFIYVGVEALDAFLGKAIQAPFLSTLTFRAGKILSAVMRGLVYYGAGEIAGLLGKWLADAGAKEDLQ